jgi:hypothetical protein
VKANVAYKYDMEKRKKKSSSSSGDLSSVFTNTPTPPPSHRRPHSNHLPYPYPFHPSPLPLHQVLRDLSRLLLLCPPSLPLLPRPHARPELLPSPRFFSHPSLVGDMLEDDGYALARAVGGGQTRWSLGQGRGWGGEGGIEGRGGKGWRGRELDDGELGGRVGAVGSGG